MTCCCSLPHIWKFCLNHSRVLLSSIVLVYSETLRTVPLLKVPVLSAHLPDKRAPCILPCYAGSALVPSSWDQDRAAVDHLVFIASSLTSNESSRFLDSTSTPNPARSGLRCVQECVFFWHGWQFFVELPDAVSGEQLWWSQYRSRTQSIVIREQKRLQKVMAGNSGFVCSTSSGSTLSFILVFVSCSLTCRRVTHRIRAGLIEYALRSAKGTKADKSFLDVNRNRRNCCVSLFVSLSPETRWCL